MIAQQGAVISELWHKVLQMRIKPQYMYTQSLRQPALAFPS